MADSDAQNFSNHTKWVPLYHYVGTPIVVVLVSWNVYRVFTVPGVDSAMSLLSAVTLAILLALVRLFPLKAQNRLIRLEEQMRLARLLPADLQSRIGEFTVGQLVAMRFASDQELPQLARHVLEKNLTSRKAIKMEIKNWRPDTYRL